MQNQNPNFKESISTAWFFWHPNCQKSSFLFIHRLKRVPRFYFWCFEFCQIQWLNSAKEVKRWRFGGGFLLGLFVLPSYWGLMLWSWAGDTPLREFQVRFWVVMLYISLFLSPFWLLFCLWIFIFGTIRVVFAVDLRWVCTVMVI